MGMLSSAVYVLSMNNFGEFFMCGFARMVLVLGPAHSQNRETLHVLASGRPCVFNQTRGWRRLNQFSLFRLLDEFVWLYPGFSSSSAFLGVRHVLQTNATMDENFSGEVPPFLWHACTLTLDDRQKSLRAWAEGVLKCCRRRRRTFQAGVSETAKLSRRSLEQITAVVHVDA